MSKHIEEYLSSHAFFTGLDESYLKFLADSAAELKVVKGHVLFQQGKQADKFYLLRNGEISIQIPALMGPVLEIQTLSNDQLPWLVLVNTTL